MGDLYRCGGHLGPRPPTIADDPHCGPEAGFREARVLHGRGLSFGFESQGVGRAGDNAGWGQSFHLTLVAEGALLHDPGPGVELRRLVGTHPRAVAAAHAHVLFDEYRTGAGVLRIGVGGAAGQAGRLEAVVAGEGEVEDRRHRQPLRVERVDSPPAQIPIHRVLVVARDNARRTAGAAGKIEDEERLRHPTASTSTALSWKAAPWPMSVSRAAESRLTPPPSEIHQPLWIETQPGRRL